MEKQIATRFAPAGRVPPAELQRQTGYFAERGFTRQLLDSLPDVLAILNHQRQIIFANRALLELIGVQEESLIYGQRPGEALDCVHAAAGADGCGTTEHCSTCGAVLAILASGEGQRAVRECRITRCVEGRQQAMDLRIFATPMIHAGEHLTIFAASDISHEKRRSALERTFFHDILNVVGGIRGFAELLTSYELDNQQEIFRLIHDAARQTIEEIEAQRTLNAAESGELTLRPESFELRDFLSAQLEIYRHHEAGRDRELRLAEPGPELLLRSDRVLLGRVLGNMLKNALEACSAGEAVEVGVHPGQGAVEIAVHNPGVIPREAQLQIFQRSFSTKGEGRGLGTYSMQLLSGYLGAEVSFTSTAGKGTVFRLRLPTGFS